MKTKSVVRTRVFTVTCPDCKAEMYSRARHDFHGCFCGTFVDGGFDYVRYGGKDLNSIVKRTRYVKATRQELYDDWNNRKDQFGFIKGATNA